MAPPRQLIQAMCLVAVLLMSVRVVAQPSSPSAAAATSMPALSTTVILGRPTGTSIVLSVLRDSDGETVIVYGPHAAEHSLRTQVRSLGPGQPQEILLDKLKPDTRYSYQLRDVTSDKLLVEGSFHTQRAPGSPLTFTVTADSHLDQNSDLALYQRTLANALADAPDFHVDLGDTFMTGKHESREDAARQYLAQREYFGQLCRSTPLFLVLGNHDGEESRLLRGGADSLAVWANMMRKRYFPNPIPNAFYGGDGTKDPSAGLLQDYYSWQWGDALFVVLDPYWHSPVRHADDCWGLSLGATQYNWLRNTLASSKAKFKFVFIHQLTGGIDKQGRGGAEAAGFGEWGGKNADGTDGFKDHRPGWETPIHQLLVRNHVAIVFHGHDHLFAKQDLDGIVYQEVPQPGFPGIGGPRSAGEYGYRDGVILGSSGHLRVMVLGNKVTVDYVRAYAPKDENASRRNRQVAYTYTFPAGANSTAPATENGNRPPRARRPRGDDGAENALPAGVAALERLSSILGRPTDRAVTVSVLSADALEGYCEYGIASSDYTRKTALASLMPGKAVELLLDRLPPDQQCFYRLRYRKPGDSAFARDAEHAFHTQRAPGRTFTFEIQGDSHPERPQQFAVALYAQTLRAVADDRPDFYMTSGDDFSVDTLATVNAQTVAARYAFQRPFLALVAQSSPLFLLNGNHEQAAACNLDGTPNNVAVWAQNARNQLFPQPAPDSFYSGDGTPVRFIGPLRDYYAWTWGDALFIVIDPYWHSPVPVDNVLGGGPKRRDQWTATLGDEQYQWLKNTLQSSKARYKFVFAHHVLGAGRGGIEEAGLFEWGGKNRKGVNEFAQKRPGWELPIHQLLVRSGVTIFFQGHDHVFACQQLDGVVYQTLPEPADPNYTLYNGQAYRSGDVLPNSGRVRVTVSPQKVRVEYVRSYLPEDVTPAHPNGEIAFSYEIPASGPAPKTPPTTSLLRGKSE